MHILLRNYPENQDRSWAKPNETLPKVLKNFGRNYIEKSPQKYF